ncbi:MAG: zf-HC2 domain-containing protein [Acidobacteriota bacterium]|jgi:hypothetical protein
MNSACKYGEEQLVSLLYEDGETAEMVELRAHLATCADCRAELDSLISMKDLLSAWPNVVNAPRMVYVNEPQGLWARLRSRVDEFGGQLRASTFVKPAVAAAAVVLVLAVSVALLDVRVAPDGKVHIGFGGGQTMNAASAPVSREEFQQSLAQTVSYLEELFQARSDDERRLLMAAIDERMEQQGVAMSQQLRNVVDAAFTDVESQHENDLGLVFSAIDDLSVITGSELQRMNSILASLTQREPSNEE